MSEYEERRRRIGPGPAPEWEKQMREEGERIRVELGPTPSEDRILTSGGTPLRGVVRITIEDDGQSGRVVTLRCRNVEVATNGDVLNLRYEGYSVEGANSE